MVSEQKLSVELRPLFRLNQFKVVDLVSDPNLYKCIYDPDITYKTACYMLHVSYHIITYHIIIYHIRQHVFFAL